MGKLNQVDPDALRNVFLLIDPFHLTAEKDAGRTSLDLFQDAASRGCMTVLWYCARTQDEHHIVNMHFDQLITRNNQQVWRSEITLRAISDPQFIAPGVGMCGLLCANLPEHIIQMMNSLGQALECMYEDAMLPNGLSGVIEYTSRPVLESTS